MKSDSGVKDTIAYKIVDQLISHIHPSEEISDSEFIKVYRAYINTGESWESLVRGNPNSFYVMMDILSSFFKIRKHPEKFGLKNG